MNVSWSGLSDPLSYLTSTAWDAFLPLRPAIYLGCFSSLFLGFSSFDLDLLSLRDLLCCSFFYCSRAAYESISYCLALLCNSSILSDKAFFSIVRLNLFVLLLSIFSAETLRASSLALRSSSFWSRSLFAEPAKPYSYLYNFCKLSLSSYWSLSC
jgi:hypothetical protein